MVHHNVSIWHNNKTLNSTHTGGYIEQCIYKTVLFCPRNKKKKSLPRNTWRTQTVLKIRKTNNVVSTFKAWRCPLPKICKKRLVCVYRASCCQVVMDHFHTAHDDLQTQIQLVRVRFRWRTLILQHTGIFETTGCFLTFCQRFLLFEHHHFSAQETVQKRNTSLTRKHSTALCMLLTWKLTGTAK